MYIYISPQRTKVSSQLQVKSVSSSTKIPLRNARNTADTFKPNIFIYEHTLK